MITVLLMILMTEIHGCATLAVNVKAATATEATEIETADEASVTWASCLQTWRALHNIRQCKIRATLLKLAATIPVARMLRVETILAAETTHAGLAGMMQGRVVERVAEQAAEAVTGSEEGTRWAVVTE